MQPLDKALRNQLERTIKHARPIAERAAQTAVEQLGVDDTKAPDYLNDGQKDLRRRLRAHARSLGDALHDDVQATAKLVAEVAYEHWHRMLFARFLAENDLLMYDGVAITLEECEELAEEEGAGSGWALAGQLASQMLPQVFRVASPVFELTLAAEYQRELEGLLTGLPVDVFQASDSLGWVYQFWQADNKKRINSSEVKIGADELPAVTQLFTEPYMVSFLLDNALGAWWAARRLTEADLQHAESEAELREKAALPGVPLEYLRFVQEEDATGQQKWAPAAGAFEAWPEHLSELKTLDPCCGSGHFLVAAFSMLVPLRMTLENLSAQDAVDAVLRDNLHGLELDPRCVELAAFALALAAWRYPDENGHAVGVREIPTPDIACCGLQVADKAEKWERLVPDDFQDAEHARQQLRLLHKIFFDAPVLGSLIEPSQVLGNDLATPNYAEINPLIRQALARDTGNGSFKFDEREEFAVQAQGLLATTRILSDTYHLVFTNVPFLTNIKYSDALKEFIDAFYETGKANLATAMVVRLLELLKAEGVATYVSPQSWMFLKGYTKFRTHLMKERAIRVVARLGEHAFHSADANGEQVSLNIIGAQNSKSGSFYSLDVSHGHRPKDKAYLVASNAFGQVDIRAQMNRPQQIISLSSNQVLPGIDTHATALRGCGTGDSVRFVRCFWEISNVGCSWSFHNTTARSGRHFDGLTEIILWENEQGVLAALAESVKHLNHSAQNWRRGKPNWGRKGVIVSQMGEFPAALYTGEIYDPNCCAIVSEDEQLVPALWAFCSSDTFYASVRAINQNRKVEVRTFLAVGFDESYWTKIAEEQYPHGLPQPYSDDSTQWLFHGHPSGSVIWDEDSKWTAHGPLRTDDTVLQVAVARLLGYRWPAELDADMELADEARAWVEQTEALLPLADKDGIVCIPPVRGEAAGADRLFKLLVAAYGDEWSNDVLAQLLKSVGHDGKSLESWLRDKFFAQHCKLFHNRPFIWQVWDGLKDGFSALVNYHRLDYKTLETLTYTYLGDWITAQNRAVKDGIDGAEEKLAAGQALKKSLMLILEGEQPHDIFVRWKPLAEQPIGWHPDLNDGVRLNIRPFMSVPDVKKKGAGILRDKPNIHWKKDRGKDVESAPWYRLGLQYGGKEGDRINDHHLTVDEKSVARETKQAQE